MPYKVLKVDAGHWDDPIEVASAHEAIELGDAIIKTGFGAVFICRPNETERIPLREFKARMRDDA